MATIFFQEEEVLKKSREVLNSGQIETENDKLLYEQLVQEYDNLLYQMKRVVKMSDMIGGKLNSDYHAVNEISKTDYLTNVYNRRFFDDLLLREWVKANQTGQILSVLMIDVDCFKLYNDNYGHIEGDKALQNIAQAIKDSLDEKQSIVARYGGEEFIVLLIDTNLSEAKLLGDKIRQNVEQLHIVHQGATEYDVITISTGIAANENEKIQSYQALVNCADMALYEAKRHGKNKVEIWQAI